MLVLFAGPIIFFERKSYFERQHFYKSKLNNIIVKIKSNWSGGRSYDYIFENKIVLTLTNDHALKIKDSIVKKANSWKFDIFRTGEFDYDYKYYTNLDLQQINR